MKISAPSLKLDLSIRDVEVRDGEPVVLCRIGVYETVARLDGTDVRAAMRALLRPRVILAMIRLALRRPPVPKTGS